MTKQEVARHALACNVCQMMFACVCCTVAHLPSWVVLKQSACLAVPEANLDVFAFFKHSFVLLHWRSNISYTFENSHHQLHAVKLPASLFCMDWQI